MQSLGIEVDEDLSEYELCIAANLVDTRAIRTEWSDIGGLEHVINEINEVIILPFTRPQLFSTSTLLQPPKGEIIKRTYPQTNQDGDGRNGFLILCE